MKTMVDLFCGRGGWSKGFIAEGWNCIGLDLFPQPLYPGQFIQIDIAQTLELPHADFYCCSSPCEQFSIHCMKHFHKNPKWPWLGISLFNHSHWLLEQTGKPFIMENVRCAEKFVGRSVNHFGPFYVWGNSVPALMPPESFKVNKNLYIGTGSQTKNMTKLELREYRRQFTALQKGSKRDTAMYAEIPLEISQAIAKFY